MTHGVCAACVAGARAWPDDKTGGKKRLEGFPESCRNKLPAHVKLNNDPDKRPWAAQATGQNTVVIRMDRPELATMTTTCFQ